MFLISKKYILQVALTITLVLSSCTSENDKNISIKSTYYDGISSNVFFSAQDVQCDKILRASNVFSSEVIGCIRGAPYDLSNQFVDHLLKHQSTVSKELLGDVLKEIVENHHTSGYVDIVKKLILAGAPTDNVSLQHITNGHDIACKTTVLVLEANKDLYKKNIELNTQIYGQLRKKDLLYQADTGHGRAICSKAIRLLISYNPELRDIQNGQGSTPLHVYLADKHHPDWDLEIAKLLMTSKNVNKQNYRGSTPLHFLLYFSKSDVDVEIIRSALRLDVDLDIKDKEGISLRDLIDNRPELVGLFN